MKSADYVYTVTSIYRRLLDENRNSTRAENIKLERAFSRGGFTDGYFTGKTFEKMTGIRTEEDKRRTDAEEKGDFTCERVKVKAKVKMKLGEPAEMTLLGIDTDREITVSGDCPESAKNAPLTVDGVKERLSKMGNTFLSLSPLDIELELDEGINLPPSLINKLRRDAAEKFEDFSREIISNDSEGENTEKINTPPAFYDKKMLKRTAVFYNSEQLTVLDGIVLGYFDAVFAPLSSYKSVAGKANGVYLPPVIMEDEIKDADELISAAKDSGALYALIGNPSHVELARRHGLTPIGDFRLNVTNAESLQQWHRMGISDVIISPELTARQSRAIGGRAIVYGRIPLMITERCFMKENFGCDKCGKCHLTDRKGVKFPMMREARHRNLIFNSAYTYMADKQSEAAGLSYHFIFSTENAKEVKQIVLAFKEKLTFPLDGQFRRMGKRKAEG